MSDDGEEKRLVPRRRTRREASAPARADAGAPKPQPQARFARLDDLEVLRESLELQPGDLYQRSRRRADLSARGRAGLDVTQVTPRGQYRVEAELDLHGQHCGPGEAGSARIPGGMLRAQARCVRIVHGKGLRSGHRGPVIRNAVNALLQRTDAVLAFCSARPVDGGTGAIYVLLRCAVRPARPGSGLTLQALGEIAQRGLCFRAEPGFIHRLIVRAAEVRDQIDEVGARQARRCAIPRAGAAMQSGAHSRVAGTTSLSSVTRSISPDASASSGVMQDAARDQPIGNTGADQLTQRAVDDWPWKQPHLHFVEADPVFAGEPSHGNRNTEREPRPGRTVTGDCCGYWDWSRRETRLRAKETSQPRSICFRSSVRSSGTSSPAVNILGRPESS